MSEELNEEQLENVSGGAGMNVGRGDDGMGKEGGEEHGFDMGGEGEDPGADHHPEDNPHEFDSSRGEQRR